MIAMLDIGCKLPANAAGQEDWQTISNRWAPVSIDAIQDSAKKGDVTAQYYLAIAYASGDRVSNDPAEAFTWMQLAARQGMARAQRKLGQMYENGYGVLQDYTEAAKFYREGAEQGDAMAQNNLGWLYSQGTGVPKDVKEALKWYQKSAGQGESLAEENLAWMYAQGVYGPVTAFGQGADAQIRSGGIAPDHQLAEQWMRKAVDLNSPDGQCKFGDLLYAEVNSNGVQDTTSFPAAAEWYAKSAEQGYTKAEFELAEMYNTGKLGDDQRSNCISWYLKAAAQGNSDAQAEVGELPQLYPGNALLKPVNNIQILLQAAESGNPDAQFQLARRYQTGIGVPQDAKEAFKWMQKAAERPGDAQYYLGMMYEKGEGTDRNLQKAYQLYEESAITMSSDLARFRFGQMCERGEGVAQNLEEAVHQYSGTYYFSNHPDLYPNGYVGYEGPTYQSIESLLRLWAKGLGLPSEKEKKMPLYKDPANQLKLWQSLINTPMGEFYLGEIYYQGKLVPLDLVEAATRFQIAAGENVDDASKALNEVNAKLSPAEKEDMRRRFPAEEQSFEMARVVVADDENAQHFMSW